ncbi:hypothetical protein YY92_08335 [Campylobacter fetus]|uniref:hypothetical protein n=1 Tax=Campylobacter fetus TaxID=196 RepID=UPI0011CBC4FD|nr:hypothetical protein [Campylobacter fetus]EAJ1232604.1 hypothetical protein [Campylobacter fetus]EAK0414717.1 hypothetical protein [Campylobacter fetus]TXF09167.1 hypothetical protein FPD25_03270 [Campylobacter fetus subsp. fetus]
MSYPSLDEVKQSFKNSKRTKKSEDYTKVIKSENTSKKQFHIKETKPMLRACDPNYQIVMDKHSKLLHNYFYNNDACKKDTQTKAKIEALKHLVDECTALAGAVKNALNSGNQTQINENAEKLVRLIYGTF